jgi:hypothetical protein
VVFIIVAVQNSLLNIKHELGNRGYTIVDLENYNYPIDAAIYEGNSFQISYISGNNMPEMSNSKRSSYGVLIINSLGKSVDEIEDMLKTRYYSPLF